MFARYLSFFYLPVYICVKTETLETFCNINGKYPLHSVSDKFLSLSIDPAVLLAGLNLSDTSLLLAEHLSPAYIRIAGPSTRYVKYLNNDDKSDSALSEDEMNVVVTPPMWFGINEWLKSVNLTPVFGISDAETTGGVWNPKSTLPLLELSDKLNVSCYWMLGFDPSGKTEAQYVRDLTAFKNVLHFFPNRNVSWNIVGSDLSKIPKDSMGTILQDLDEIVTAVMWEPNLTEESFPEKKSSSNLVSQTEETQVKIWTVAPKPTTSITFSSALTWAEQVGNAAKMGYDVVFRQPRIHEIFSDTPVYWFSLLHKKLMGTNVLEAKPSVHHPGCSVYAHCTRNQQQYNTKGVLTLMVVNRNLENFKMKIKLGQIPMTKFTEVQSYILTSLNENGTDTFLNDERLTPAILLQKDPLKAEKHTTKCKPYISLKAPPLSISFFVLPRAVSAACTTEESLTEFHQQEANTKEYVPRSFFGKELMNFQSRGSFGKNPALKELKEKMKKEMEADDKLFKSNLKSKLGTRKQRILSESVEYETESMQEILEKKKLQEKRRKQVDLAHRREELKKMLLERKKERSVYKEDGHVKPRLSYMDLTSAEERKILRDRAKSKAAKKNVVLNDKELDFIVDAVKKTLVSPRFKDTDSEDDNIEGMNIKLLGKAMFPSADDPLEELSKKYTKTKLQKPLRIRRDINTKLLNIKSKLEENRQRLEERQSDIVGNAHSLKRNIQEKLRKLKYKNHHRYKRDINMELLKLKTEGDKEKKSVKLRNKKLFKNREEKEATIRKPGQTSDELLEEEDSTEDSQSESDDFFKSHKKKFDLFDNKPNLSPFAKTKSSNSLSKLKSKKNKNGPKEIDDSLTFLTTSDEFNDIEEDLPCIYEYFGSNGDKPNKIKQVDQGYQKLKKNNSKTKKVEFGDEVTSDSMEYLRKKRSQISDRDNIKELGEVDYIHVQKIGKTSKTDKKNDASKELKKKDTCKANGNVPKIKNDKETTRNKDVEDSSNERKQLNKRRRRSTDEKEDDKLNEDEKHVKPVNKFELRQRLKEAVIKARTTYEDLAKTKLKLPMQDKNQEEKDEEPDTFKGIIDEEKKKQVLEKLQVLKAKLTPPKKDMGEMNLQQRLSDLGMKIKSRLNPEPSSVKMNQPTTSSNLEGTPIPTPAEKVKRSLFEPGCDLFGRYNPLAPNLKEWKPADILSLKMDQNLLRTPRLNPLNDLQMFKNVITPNKYLSFGRKRRSVKNRIPDGDFDVDNYLNDIQKDPYLSPRELNRFQEYKLMVPKGNENLVKKEDSMSEMELEEEVPKTGESKFEAPEEESEENTKREDIIREISLEMLRQGHSFDGRTETTTMANPEEDIEDVKEAADDVMVVANRMSDHIQKIPKHQEEDTAMEDFLSKVSGFFTSIGQTLKNYMQHLT